MQNWWGGGVVVFIVAFVERFKFKQNTAKAKPKALEYINEKENKKKRDVWRWLSFHFNEAKIYGLYTHTCALYIKNKTGKYMEMLFYFLPRLGWICSRVTRCFTIRWTLECRRSE